MTAIHNGSWNRKFDAGVMVPGKVLCIEISEPLSDINNLENYNSVAAVVRVFKRPIGYLILPVENGVCRASKIAKAIVNKLGTPIFESLVRHRIDTPISSLGIDINTLLKQEAGSVSTQTLPVTVAICTRNRHEMVELCLDSIKKLEYPDFEVLVVDNAPTDDNTYTIVTKKYPNFRYILEPRPGLNWARNRAIECANGAIIAFTDDDVVVEPNWLQALTHVFYNNPEVMAVTGLISPYELETEAQVLFETFGGFGRGFRRNWNRVNFESSKDNTFHIGAGRFGAGANMAFRRTLFNKIGLFDPALDVGTVTTGGGDLEFFFRTLQEGFTLVYEPSALVWHRHRKSYPELLDQLGTWGTAVSAYLVRNSIAYSKLRGPIVKFVIWWFWQGYLKPLFTSLLRPDRFPRKLLTLPLSKSVTGFRAYHRARLEAKLIAKKFDGDSTRSLEALAEHRLQNTSQNSWLDFKKSIAIRTVDLTKPTLDIEDVKSYSMTRVYVKVSEKIIGYIEVPNGNQAIRRQRILDLIATQYSFKLINHVDINNVYENFFEALRKKLIPSELNPLEKASIKTRISIILATYDRPQSLYRCLQALHNQTINEELEIIVVDNNPSSGLTSPIVCQFPNTLLVKEPIKGLAFARNTGVCNSTGEIIVMTDDDVIPPPHWLEKLISPFTRNDVAAVTGNVLPLELETEAQIAYENYGGLGRGFERFEVNSSWFTESNFIPAATWQLGATANAAFRRSIFYDKEIGLMNEVLGPGTPTGGGEDIYLFYKIAKEGFTIAYEPDAFVLHSHRKTLKALRSQIYQYSKGHMSYLLTTLFQDRDLRALMRIFWSLPQWHLTRIFRLYTTSTSFSTRLILLEMLGNLMAPWSLLQSHYSTKQARLTRPKMLPEVPSPDNEVISYVTEL